MLGQRRIDLPNELFQDVEGLLGTAVEGAGP